MPQPNTKSTLYCSFKILTLQTFIALIQVGTVCSMSGDHQCTKHAHLGPTWLHLICFHHNHVASPGMWAHCIWVPCWQISYLSVRHTVIGSGVMCAQWWEAQRCWSTSSCVSGCWGKHHTWSYLSSPPPPLQGCIHYSFLFLLLLLMPT
jgi:hypothetical protein